MPKFEAELYADPSEFIDLCSIREVKQLIDILIEDGHIHKFGVKNNRDNDKNWSYLDDELVESLQIIFDNRMKISTEDLEAIKNISKKL